MAKANVFWDRIARRYARSPISNPQAYEKKLEIMQGYLGPKMQLLEFGCGTGSTALRLAPHVSQIHAIDISANMIAIAREKITDGQPSNLTFEVAGIDDFVPPKAGYSAVLAMNILHLVSDRDAVIGRVHDMLAPGGVFISSTACTGGALRLLKPAFALGRWTGLLPLLRFFTEDHLVASLTRAGFKIDHRSRPGKGMAVFIVAKKAA